MCDWCDPRSDLWPAKPEAVVGTGADVYLSSADSQSEGKNHSISPGLARLMLKQHGGAFIGF